MQNSIFRLRITNNLYYLAGSFLYALGIYTFALNAQFVPGGVSGIALLINHSTHWPVGLLTLVLNIPLVLLCWRVVGAAFIFKSLWVMLLNSLFLDLVFPFLPVYKGENQLLAAIFTGVAAGAGLALIYMRGASSGGVDFISMAVKKKRPHYSIGQILLAIDALVILAGGLVYRDVDAVLYGVIASFTVSKVLDSLLYGAGGGKMALIITGHGTAIAKAIDVEVARGSTLIKASGTYTGAPRDILLCACSKNEIYKVRMVARAIDPASMVMITEASEVIGEGFSPAQLPGSEDPAQG